MALLPGIGPKANFANGNTNVRTRHGAERAMRFSFRGAFKYTFLPGIMPRIRQLGSHFGIIAHMLACIFSSAKLLPKGHPMLNPANIGRFGVTDVLAAAANNLVVKRENTDQILIFGAIIMAMIMIVIQVAMIAFYSVIGSAHATGATGTTASANMFTTENPNADVVLSFLQQVTGVGNFFNNDESVGFSIAKGIHAMLGFYSTAMMVIAVFIVLYYVVIVVGESAQSGKPFGGRFNSLWAPIRLVLALGLLVPLGSGLNAAQYLTLYVAKAGSSLATNAWKEFSGIITDPSKTTVPPYPLGIGEVAQQIFLNEVCMAGYNKNPAEGKRASIWAWVPDHKAGDTINLLKGAIPEIQHANAIFYDQNMVSIEWGHVAPDLIGTFGLTKQTEFSCGVVRLKYTPPSGNPNITEADKNIEAAANAALTYYAQAMSQVIAKVRGPAQQFADHYRHSKETNTTGALKLPDSKFLVDAIAEANAFLRDKIMKTDGPTYSRRMMEALFPADQDITANGWGMAATYYSKLAFANQTILDIFREAAPVSVREINDTTEALVWSKNRNEHFGIQQLWGDKYAPLGDSADEMMHMTAAAYTIVERSGTDRSGAGVLNQHAFADQWAEDNNFTQLMKALFGLKALQQMADPDNVNVFPMVHLVNIGNELITKAVDAFFVGAGTSLVGGIFGVFNEGFGAGISAVGNLIFIFGFIGLGIGFILAIVVPMMPFIYFFFAIVEWGMSVIEALVGVPLWALAHLRIDGDGLPGQAAMNGYYIFLGMLIKPFLILFSLLASFVVFNAGAYFLNLTFGSYVFNITDATNPEAQKMMFGMTLAPIAFVGNLILYGVIVYNLGLVCFKMIDTIPAQSMRWLGQGNLNFNDGKPDPIGNMSGVAMAAGGIIGGQVASGLGTLGAQTGAATARGAAAGARGLGRMGRGRGGAGDA